MIDDKTTEKSFVPVGGGEPPPMPPAAPDLTPAQPPPRIPDYELLRVIGRGSYGEVWLARNVMGGFRAVKVIYRRTFEHQRPYEREFEGIKRYEPVSRTHESQVAVLHVGRHERDEYYYYVMELADDATVAADVRRLTSKAAEGSQSLLTSAAAYSPRTLASDLKQRGKLPLDECISLGLSLATALEHLHSHGLIHRDVKPSNVVFVKGVPKLADVGLVAEKDSTVSFVGTRGYFPPEGPGTAQADLYSLGKVLYEISTGKDRNEFPDLPSDLENLTEEARLLEFNEILLKACHGDVRRRYASARELFDDLALLKDGRSVKKKRRRERLRATAQRIAGFVGLVLLVATGGYLLNQERTTLRLAKVSDIYPAEAAFWRTYHHPRAFDFSPEGTRIVFGDSEHASEDLRVWEEGTFNTRRGWCSRTRTAGAF
jgi:serine/threonine protein kinase